MRVKETSVDVVWGCHARLLPLDGEGALRDEPQQCVRKRLVRTVFGLVR